MEAVFHPEALDEYERSVSHYAVIQRQLGKRFRDTMEAAIDACSESPLTYAIVEHDVRRCVVRRFPYAVLYTIEPDDHVLIVAVMHCHREPGYWRHRVASEA